MGATHVSVGGHHGLHSVLIEEIPDFSANLWVVFHVGADPPLQKWISPFSLDNRRCDLGRSLVVGAVECNGPDGELRRKRFWALLLFLQAALLVFLSTATRARIIPTHRWLLARAGALRV